ncbi:MAG TPA: DUF445 domain-containing protein [Candidatus Acidoferrales bacterium]|nr:DUF445 domain-containing protein [Candidatus Acidoferrales bacterium]
MQDLAQEEHARIDSPPRPALATRADVAPRNHIGTISLLLALSGAVACRVLRHTGVFGDASWIELAAAGFDAALVGGLADWFAVTALFRHPLGLPIPHTAIIPMRRAKIVEGIVSMVQDEWLSPDVIAARLKRLSSSEIVIDWLREAEHVARLGAPLRDLLRAVARLLTEPAVIDFVERTTARQLREVPIDASAGRLLLRAAESDASASAFQSAALSLASLARRPETAVTLQAWLDHAARQLHSDGKRLVPLILRRKMIQRKIVEAACDYAAAELSAASTEGDHALRRYVFGLLRRFGERLANGDPQALQQVEQLREALVDSLEARPLIREMLTQLRQQLEHDLGDDSGKLAQLIDDQLRGGILDLLDDPANRARLDEWVRNTAADLLRRHHHQIGLTVRENLEGLETSALVAQIEERVGNDLQFIRLNGALVGGIIGILLHVLHRFLG